MLPDGSPAAEAAASAGVGGEGVLELAPAEVRPERLDEDELRVGELPEQEVRDPELPGGADQQVRVGQVRCVEVRPQEVLVDLGRLDTCLDQPPRRLDQLRAPAV